MYLFWTKENKTIQFMCAFLLLLLLLLSTEFVYLAHNNVYYDSHINTLAATTACVRAKESADDRIASTQSTNTIACNKYIPFWFRWRYTMHQQNERGAAREKNEQKWLISCLSLITKRLIINFDIFRRNPRKKSKTPHSWTRWIKLKPWNGAHDSNSAQSQCVTKSG